MEKSKPNQAKVQEIAERAQALGELKKHPSWRVLRDVFDKRRHQYFESLARQLMRGSIDAPVVPQRELDYQRGFWAGAKWILDNPEMAETSLEHALRRAELYKEMV